MTEWERKYVSFNCGCAVRRNCTEHNPELKVSMQQLMEEKNFWARKTQDSEFAHEQTKKLLEAEMTELRNYLASQDIIIDDVFMQSLRESVSKKLGMS